MVESPLEQPAALVVEDDELVRGTLQRTLEAAGFRVWTASDGPRGVELFQRHHGAIRVALLDCKLPGFSGLEAMQALRDIDARVPCCLITGAFDPWSPESLQDADPDAIFYKPFRMDQLTARLWQIAQSERLSA
jgi:DNA-binding response OmpR family regulator